MRGNNSSGPEVHAEATVQSVIFDEHRIHVELNDGRVVGAPLVWFPRLLNASAAERKDWLIAGGGAGVHWPQLDEDLSVAGLLRGAPSVEATKPSQPAA